MSGVSWVVHDQAACRCGNSITVFSPCNPEKADEIASRGRGECENGLQIQLKIAAERMGINYFPDC